VAAALHRAGVTVTPRQPARPPLDPAVLRRLYVEERRTLGQVAAALGASDRRVRAAMVAAGIPLRPARRRADLAALPTLSRAQLTELYLRQRLTTGEIAARYGGSENWVRTALAARAIGRRTGGLGPFRRSSLTRPPSPTSTSPAGSTTRRSPPGSGCPPGG
jgi:DNA-binding CsgD family transcriptional regulator